MFISALTVLSVAAVALGQLTINTPPSVVACQPSMLSWSGGTAPYFLYTVGRLLSSILPGNQPGAPPLIDLGQQNGTSVTWTPTLPPGTPAFAQIRDNTGALNQSGIFTIQSGTNNSCVGSSVSVSSGPAATTLVAAASTPAAATTTSATRSAASGTASSTKSAGSAAPTSGAAKFASSSALCLFGVFAVAALL